MASKKPFIDTDKLATLDSTSFYQTFKKYDKDGNNYIEAKEIDAFMKDLFKLKYGSNYSKDKVKQLKDYIMNKYDKNHDNKLDITELADILPVEENFLLKMKHPVRKSNKGQVMSSVEFMKIWINYDPYREGYLGREQLRGFIADYLEFYEEPKKPADEAEKQVGWLLNNFDKDHDGEITMTELQGFLKVENNFLKSYEIKKHGFSAKDFDKLWSHYDPDQNGRIGGAELDALVRDLYFKFKKEDPDMKDISDWRDIIMRFSDRDGDEEVSKEEMETFMTKGLNNALKRLK